VSTPLNTASDNWGLRLLGWAALALDWIDRLAEDVTMMWAHWRLLRRARCASPIDRVLIACGYEIVAAGNARANAPSSSSEKT
jgi:hypothetical protein